MIFVALYDKCVSGVLPCVVKEELGLWLHYCCCV